MTYSDFILRVRQEVNVDEVLPEVSGDPAIAAKILNLAHIAVLVVAGEVPAKRLASKQSTLSVQNQGTIKVAALPAELFAERPDHGIVNLLLDGQAYDMDGMYSTAHLRAAAGNPFQKGVPHAAIRPHERLLYFVNASLADLIYIERPEKPTPQNYTTQMTPLSGNDVETAVQLVAAHLTGVRGGDPQLAALHKQFSQLYLNRAS